MCLAARCVTTPADGRYRFEAVAPGNYWLTVKRSSYLASKRAATVPLGLLTLPDVTLLGGDIDQDGHIYVRDMVAVGVSWATHPSDLAWDQRADITADDAINVLDMVAVQYNWDARAPGPWLTASLLPQSHPPAERPLTDTRVFIAPANATLSAPGQAIELAVRVEEVADLYGLGFSITFDPAVLRVRDADPRPSAPGVQIRPGDFLDPFNQFVVVNQADNTLGRIEFAATQTQPAQARNGAGVLATITFEAVAEGSSAVTFAEVELVNDARPDPQIIPDQPDARSGHNRKDPLRCTCRCW